MSRLAVLNAAVIKVLEQKKVLQTDKKLLQEKLAQSVARIEHNEMWCYKTCYNRMVVLLE